MGSLVLFALLLLSIPIDRARRRSVLFYELEPNVAEAVDALYQALDELGRNERLWHIPRAESAAGGRYTRTAIRLRYGTPRFLKTNLEVPFLPAGRQTLYFMPEQLLVVDPKGVGAVSYRELGVEERLVRELEEEHLPADARVIEWRWKHETKSGRADRRYKNNYKIPSVEYRRVRFTSATGVNELFQSSRAASERSVRSCVERIVAATAS